MTTRSEKIYGLLLNEEDTRACEEIGDEACREVPGNFLRILLAQFLTKLADSLSSSKIVLPWLLTGVGAPAFFGGILVPIRESGSLLPQLLIGGVVRRFAVRKWFFVIGSLLQGTCVAMMIWVANTTNPVTAGYGVIGLLIIFSLARGLCSIASKDVLGKTIPKRRRGTLSGYAASVAGLVTVGVGVSLVSTNSPDTVTVNLMLAGAALCWFLAAASYSRIAEYAGASDGSGNALKQAIASLGLLHTDKDFRHFVITRCLLMSSGLSAPYFIILSRQNSETNLALSLPIFIMISGFASVISSVVWGKFADANSRRVIQVSALGTALLCATASIFSSNYFSLGSGLLLLLFFLLSVVYQGARLGRKTYLVDLAGGNKRTDYVAVSNTVIGVMILLIGLSGAILASFSITIVLALFAISALLAVWMSRKLPNVS